jgi:hypothetical protein
MIPELRPMTDPKSYLFHGENLTLSEIARRLGVKRNTLWARINVTGLTPEEAFRKPNCSPGQGYEKIVGPRDTIQLRDPVGISTQAQGAFNWRMLTELEKLEQRQQDLVRDITKLRQKLADGIEVGAEDSLAEDSA